MYILEINRITYNRKYYVDHPFKQKNKLVGRAENIHPQRKWRYGFAITPPGVLETCWFCKASTEVRDRTSARAVPRSR